MDGRFVYLSYAIAKKIQMYAFVHEPIYQHVNKVQLTADRSAIAGVNVRFCAGPIRIHGLDI
jgi:hypothetical protein